MNTENTVKITILIALTVIFSTFIYAEPPNTECTENPESPACQKPLYTDNQAEYLHDIRASVLNTILVYY